MSRRLPPLNALRAFEAAARHLSFTRAAEELNVTQAAVSHQVKALEQRLGIKFFTRRGRTLILTAEAQRYLPAVRDAFDRLSTATNQLLAPNSGSTLTVSLIASFAAQWLVPRIARFRDLHPTIDVRLHAVDELIDFSRDDVDVAIRYGRGVWSGLRIDKLLDEKIFPVCSPALLTGPKALKELGDLRHHELLHEGGVRIDWRTWLAAAGVPQVDSSRGTVFSHGYMVVQAAVNGQGVAMARTSLVNAELADGRLVVPFDMALPSEHAHYVVCPTATAEQPKIVAFRDWLFAEVAAEKIAGSG